MTNDSDIELIRITTEVKDWLDSLKVLDRQTYADLLKRIMILLKKEKDLKTKLNGIDLRS